MQGKLFIVCVVAFPCRICYGNVHKGLRVCKSAKSHLNTKGTSKMGKLKRDEFRYGRIRFSQ